MFLLVSVYWITVIITAIAIHYACTGQPTGERGGEVQKGDKQKKE